MKAMRQKQLPCTDLLLRMTEDTDAAATQPCRATWSDEWPVKSKHRASISSRGAFASLRPWQQPHLLTHGWHSIQMQQWPDHSPLHRITMQQWPDHSPLHRITMQQWPDHSPLHRITRENGSNNASLLMLAVCNPLSRCTCMHCNNKAAANKYITFRRRPLMHWLQLATAAAAAEAVHEHKHSRRYAPHSQPCEPPP
jgi:hypothetical protein